MTETYILALCFVLTFGFIGYKLSHLIKNVSQQYRNQIADKINESERLKLHALNLLDEAKKRENIINDEIENYNRETELKILSIKAELEEKFSLVIQKIHEENKKKIENEQNILVEKFKSQVRIIISEVIDEYGQKISQEEKENAVAHAIIRLDFKKLTQQN